MPADPRDSPRGASVAANKEPADGRWKILRSRLDQESHYDGVHPIETGNDTLGIRDIMPGYLQLGHLARFSHSEDRFVLPHAMAEIFAPAVDAVEQLVK